jgi:cell pole-organizing protein PopZ
MRQEGEPSVEEILDSIKKVIARDNRAAIAPAASRPMDDHVRAAQSVPELAPEPAWHDEADDILDLAESDELMDAAAPVRGPLIDDAATAAMRESLATLAVLAEPGSRPQVVRSGETSLEELTRELLRPALAEWLDANLPPLVERMVAAEISRIVGKRG